MPKKTKANPSLKFDQLEEKVLELEQKWRRALADYQNLEKRIEGQRMMYVQMANVDLVDKLLPVLDDLQRAAKHLKEDGLKIILKQFVSVLEDQGVVEIEAKGEEFDPNIMDCVEMVGGERNRVMEIVESGYKLADTVIRPAKVKVGNGVIKNNKK